MNRYQKLEQIAKRAGEGLLPLPFDVAKWMLKPNDYVQRARKMIGLAGEIDGPVFDVGCGAGFLIWLLRQQGVEAWGSDSQCTSLVHSTLHQALAIDRFTMLHSTAPFDPYPWPIDHWHTVFATWITFDAGWNEADWQQWIEATRLNARQVIVRPNETGLARKPFLCGLLDRFGERLAPSACRYGERLRDGTQMESHTWVIR